MAVLSNWLGVINMLPIPPMDGSKFFFAIASDELYFKLMRYERYGMLIILFIAFSGLIGLPIADRFFGALSTAVSFVLNLLSFVSKAGYGLVSLFL
jgi:Zn-dependent protease